MQARSILSCIYDLDDLRCLEALRPEALGETVLAFEVDVHIALTARGIRHLTPWDVVATEQRPELEAYGEDVLRFWDAHARIDDHGLDLLAVARYRHHTCLRQLAWMAFVIRQALTVCDVKRVRVFEVNACHGLQQPPGFRRMPMLFAVLRGVAERQGCAVDVIRRPTALDAGFVDKVALDAAVVHPPIELRDILDGRDYVLFCGNGEDLLRQLPLIQALRSRSDAVVPVQIYKSADARVVETLNQSGHLLFHESQLTRTPPSVDVLPAADESRVRFRQACRGIDGPLADVFDNPYADQHFDFVFGSYARRIARHARTWRTLFGSCRPRSVLGNFALPAMELAHHLGIPCLELMHGMIAMGHVLNTLCISPWTLGALSDHHRERLLQRGAGDVVVTGDPWIQARCRQPTKASDDVAGGRRDLGVEPGEPLVVLLTGNLGLYSRMDGMPVVNWVDAVACVRQLGRLAARRTDWRFGVRCHPRFDHPQLYDQVNRGTACGRMPHLRSGSLEHIARLADVLVVCNATTSAMIEASLCDRPVWLLDTAMCWYDPEDWGLQDWHHVHSIADLEADLQAGFADEAVYRARVLETRSAVQQYLGAASDSAVERCLHLIDGRRVEQGVPAGY